MQPMTVRFVFLYLRVEFSAIRSITQTRAITFAVLDADTRKRGEKRRAKVSPDAKYLSEDKVPVIEVFVLFAVSRRQPPPPLPYARSSLIATSNFS